MKRSAFLLALAMTTAVGRAGAAAPADMILYNGHVITVDNAFSIKSAVAEKVDHNNSVATPLKDGIVVTFGSDNIPIDPRIGLYGAITRKGEDGVPHGTVEAVPRPEAIRLYTAAGPYLSWEEKKKGTIEPGKFADMIVLDSDPLTVPEAQLLTMKVLKTFVNGKQVYDLASDPHPLDAPLR